MPSKSRASSGTNEVFKEALIKNLTMPPGGKEEQLYCFVLKRFFPRPLVRAAHIFPRSQQVRCAGAVCRSSVCSPALAPAPHVLSLPPSSSAPLSLLTALLTVSHSIFPHACTQDLASTFGIDDVNSARNGMLWCSVIQEMWEARKICLQPCFSSLLGHEVSGGVGSAVHISVCCM